MGNEIATVIVPVYNVKEYFADCVDSIVHQSYEQIQLVLVDDGSTDGTADLCDEYAQQYSNIVVVHQENKGVGAARNTGLRYAIGEYISFVDSDDEIALDMLEKMVFILRTEPVDIVYCGFRQIFFDSVQEVPCSVPKGYYSPKEFASLFLLLTEQCITNNIGTKLYRKKLIEENEIRFEEDCNICEDISFCLRATAKSHGVYCLNECFYNYNILERGSLMSSYKPKFYEAKTRLLNNIKQYLIQMEQFDNEIGAYYKQYMNSMFAVIANEARFEEDRLRDTIRQVIHNPEVKQAKDYLADVNPKKKLICKLIWLKQERVLCFIFKQKFKSCQ